MDQSNYAGWRLIFSVWTKTKNSFYTRFNTGFFDDKR